MSFNIEVLNITKIVLPNRELKLIIVLSNDIYILYIHIYVLYITYVLCINIYTYNIYYSFILYILYMYIYYSFILECGGKYI